MDAVAAANSFLSVQNIFRMLPVLQLTAHMWPPQAKVHDGASFDFIIVGGGTAGCVLASRLAEYTNVSVLLIEAGGNPPMESLFPAYFPYMKHSEFDFNFTTIREDEIFEYHKGKVADITQGKMLGGSSSLNYMNYGYGHPYDYNTWARITEDRSWSYEAVQQLFKKSEKVIDRKILQSDKDRAQHGTTGNLQLFKYYHNKTKNYFCSFEEMGVKVVVDINRKTPLGVTNTLFTVSKRKRQSTAYSFLRLYKNNTNLFVLTHAWVTEVVFDGLKHAIGVKVRTSRRSPYTITLKANKEVILTAGVFKTPQLLLLSGIGPKEQLRKKNITVLSDLPVGKNLQDQPICVSVYRMGEREPLKTPPNPHKFEIPSLDGYFSLDLNRTYPDYHTIHLIIDDPEQFLIFCTVSFSFSNYLCNNLHQGLGDKQIFTVFNILTRPNSRGEVYLNTTDIQDRPVIRLGYYSSTGDIHRHVQAVMNFNKIINTTYFKAVKAELVDPKLEPCERLDRRTKEYWKCYCQEMVTTSHYFAGTASMGTVVDSQLLVNGVGRLRVADASIMPSGVAAPPEATVIMIAQKAADMIIRQYTCDNRNKNDCIFPKSDHQSGQRTWVKG